MRVSRHHAVLSSVLALGLFVPSAGTAFAGSAFAASGGDAATSKHDRLQRMQSLVGSTPKTSRPLPGGQLGRLAVERGSDQVLVAVKVRSGGSRALAGVAAEAVTRGGQQRRTLRQLDTVTVEVPPAAVADFTARMRQRRDVEHVEVVARRSFSFVPDDQQYPATTPYLDAVAAPAAWDVHRGDSTVRIAVVDSGVDVDHPDLAGRVTDTYNAVTGSSDVTDAVGHGTFVAGVAAATGNNGIGIAGASMGASVMAVKVADDAGQAWTDAVAGGILWAADHGANVINLSLGSATRSQVESDAVAYAVRKGVLVVAAAGNDAGTAPMYPAAEPQVVAVGATDAAGHRASFSQYGSWVTVAAPGTHVTGTAPTAGSSFFQPGYDVADGTSFSAPLVSAEAALLWSLRPGVSADDVRQAVIRSAHDYANLGLGAGQVDFRRAYDALRPDSVPTLTAPAEGATVSGAVQLSASSTAPKVRFLVDGNPLGSPVATSAGTAVATWPSWGQSNGSHTVTAVDCSTDDLCGTPQAPVTVTLTNEAPVLTSPRAAQTLSGSATFTATATGGAVAFLVDGVRRGTDTTAPYALTYPVSSLTDGTHTVQAISCSASGTLCTGPASPTVSFKALSLHPRVTGVSPSLFSPNADGRYDTTKLTYYLPDTEYVRFQVRNAAGTVVRGPSTVGTLTAGTRSVTWNGLFNNGARAAGGTYRLELVTSRKTTAGTLSGFATTSVRVDVAAPSMSSITGSGTSFYPYPDAYRDTFAPGLTLGEAGLVTLTVRNSRGTVVRSLAVHRNAGRTSIAWNGRNNAGALVAGGTYSWTLTAQDAAGNRRATARYSVGVSLKRAVARTTTLSLRGSQFRTAGGSDSSCSVASTSDSDFRPYGLWLANVCDYSSYGTQIAAGFYRFTVPAALSYTSLRVDSYGNSVGPSTLAGGFARWGTDSYSLTRGITTGVSNAWRTVGSTSAAGLVSSTRQVDVALFVPNDYLRNDYDIGYVHLVVSYKVLV